MGEPHGLLGVLAPVRGAERGDADDGDGGDGRPSHTPVRKQQLYHALKLRRIPTALVTIPGAYHNISNRPSRLIAKVRYAIAWFERYAGRETLDW